MAYKLVCEFYTPAPIRALTQEAGFVFTGAEDACVRKFSVGAATGEVEATAVVIQHDHWVTALTYLALSTLYPLPAQKTDVIKLVNSALALLFKLLLGSCYTCVWVPSTTEVGEGTMHVIVPIDINASEDDWRCVNVKTPLGEEDLSGDKFLFSNAFYEQIMKQPDPDSANGEPAAYPELTAVEAFKWVTSTSKTVAGARVLTRIAGDRAEEILMGAVEDSTHSERSEQSL